MNPFMKELAIGMASAMDLFPNDDYLQDIQPVDAESLLRNAWTTTGNHLKKSMSDFQQGLEVESLHKTNKTKDLSEKKATQTNTEQTLMIRLLDGRIYTIKRLH
ncbi:MAG: hypothetical protein H7839_15215 [Magnetococcus sp. YQC-5]